MTQSVDEKTAAFQNDIARKQIRGSFVLLSGKILSIVLTLLLQLIMVRYLSKSHYGAWGYAFVVATLLQTIAALGMKNAIKRYIPIYQEKEAYSKLFGTLALAFVTVLVMTLVFIGIIFGFQDFVSRLVKGDTTTVTLLLIMVFWVPLLAWDDVLMDILACFARARAIFYRRHFLQPVLRLLVMLLCIVLGQGVFFIAYGFITAGIIGTAIFVFITASVLKHEGLTRHFKSASVRIPLREIFAFSLPVFAADLMALLMLSIDTLMLGYFHGATEVASYTVILPAVRLNHMVLMSFAFLFMPLAARLYAKNDIQGVSDFYWRTSAWMAVMTFPVFGLTFGLAKPVTVLMYGTKYEVSSLYLQILSLAYYFQVILGFNSTTLKVFGFVRYVLAINLIALVVNIIVNLMLIPKYGALGAAIATASSMGGHLILKQLGLKWAAGLKVFNKEYTVLYYSIAACVVALGVVQTYVSRGPLVMAPLVAVASLIIFKLSPGKLAMLEAFPEVGRIPLVRFFIHRDSAD